MGNFKNDFFNSFHIGAYYLQENARTEQHIQDMKSCGIDLLIGAENDPALLDLLDRHGISAVVSGVVPGWFGGNGSNAGTMRQANPLEQFASGIEKLRDHPAIVGIDIGDEPSSVDFPHCGEITQLMNAALPQKFPYLNIYPSYGMLATNSPAQAQKELGVPSYEEYLAAYCQNIELPYISFDHYVETTNAKHLIRDLQACASYCKTYQKKLHVVLQVNSHDPNACIGEELLCFQAFCAMAHGASALSWACYCAGWWSHQVLDAEGNQTEQYEKLKRVNRRLWALAEDYDKYRWHSAETIVEGDSAEFGAFASVTASHPVLVGKFEDRNGEKAIFLTLADDKTAEKATVRFRLATDVDAYEITSGGKQRLTANENGVYQVAVEPTEAPLITLHASQNRISST